MTEQLCIWISFTGFLALSFFLSGMEAGVFALSRLRIRQQVRAGNFSAKVLQQYLDNPENFLWTILVGNTVANFLILGWIVVALHGVFTRHWFWFGILYMVIVFFFYAFFDFLPKMLFRTYPTRLCVALARPFRIIYWALRPLVAAVEWFSDLLLRWRGGKIFTGHLFGNREELRLLMQSAQTFTSEERTMIDRVLDLQTLTVRQAMLPLDRAATVTAQTRVRDVFDLARQRKLTRFPVWDTRDGTRRIIGLLTVDTLIYRSELDVQKTAGDYVQPALYLEEDLRLEIALRRMQRGGHRLAIVLARDRRELGLISLQDVLRVIFGEVSL
jgi:putative hemolysin